MKYLIPILAGFAVVLVWTLVAAFFVPIPNPHRSLCIFIALLGGVVTAFHVFFHLAQGKSNSFVKNTVVILDVIVPLIFFLLGLGAHAWARLQLRKEESQEVVGQEQFVSTKRERFVQNLWQEPYRRGWGLQPEKVELNYDPSIDDTIACEFCVAGQEGRRLWIDFPDHPSRDVNSVFEIASIQGQWEPFKETRYRAIAPGNCVQVRWNPRVPRPASGERYRIIFRFETEESPTLSLRTMRRDIPANIPVEWGEVHTKFEGQRIDSEIFIAALKRQHGKLRVIPPTELASNAIVKVGNQVVLLQEGYYHTTTHGQDSPLIEFGHTLPAGEPVTLFITIKPQGL